MKFTDRNKDICCVYFLKSTTYKWSRIVTLNFNIAIPETMQQWKNAFKILKKIISKLDFYTQSRIRVEESFSFIPSQNNLLPLYSSAKVWEIKKGKKGYSKQQPQERRKLHEDSKIDPQWQLFNKAKKSRLENYESGNNPLRAIITKMPSALSFYAEDSMHRRTGQILVCIVLDCVILVPESPALPPPCSAPTTAVNNHILPPPSPSVPF